jgi:hypothetical protein
MTDFEGRSRSAISCLAALTTIDSLGRVAKRWPALDRVMPDKFQP